MKLIAVHTTVASLQEARNIARALVERRLVACAQIAEVESFYGWEGALQNEREFRLLLNTTDAQYMAVQAAIRALHSYQLPAIYAVALEHVDQAYADWVEQCSDGAKAG
ncbi:MAG: divalent-cation tolerance protein CutA [Rhodoferax sp.]